MLPFSLPDNWSWLLSVWLVIDIVLRVVLLGVVPGNRRPNTAMAWLLAIFLVPSLGLLLFLLFGTFRLSGRRVRKLEDVNRRVRDSSTLVAAAPEVVHLPPWLASAVELNRNLGAQPLTAGNRVQLIPGYQESLDAMTDAVRQARDYVNVEFYIMAYDDATRPLFTALEEAAERGVEVRLLFDHIGTLRVRGYRRLLKMLRGSEIRWQRMLPLLPLAGQWRRPDLRNHRKIMVVDGEIAFTGSQNLTEPSYNNPKHRKAGRHWVELMARVEGPVVAGLNVVFATDWLSETDESLEAQMRFPEPVQGDIPAQVVPSGPGFSQENNLRLFNALIYSAQERISICSPYFVPDDSLLYAITTAVQRGVKVELFVSEQGDQFLVHHAQRSYYQALLEAGVRIYLYRAPAVLHAKHFTVDDEVAVLGSSNMDMRSFSLNFEVSLMMVGPEIVAALREVQEVYRAKSRELSPEEWQERSVLSKYVDNVCRLSAALQ
ncbi:cardiolipin synthase [Arthrobacter woluwensis]|uniref:Cardiolipin synthase n=1 Tax=Arthrobacter woluwensis TaxID=156980 RepID=A0A1H4KN51_9MICC|nr:cardiolipin synthase [Arthrobacter woluwensis]PSS43014.1 cardiolipin synthase [Arthrobacter woluwensis]SEB59676.1 cardiolipin synthase [Arthrobacter woluwensis]